jgi:integrase
VAELKLLDRMRALLRTRHYSIRTEDAYVQWARRYILFHGKKHPSAMGAAEINAFLSHLAVERNVSASTQMQALCAILFLYREVLVEEVPWLSELERVPRKQRTPLVLTRAEVTRLLGAMNRYAAPGRAALIWHGAATSGMPAAAGEGPRLRDRGGRDSRWQREQGPNDDATESFVRGPAPSSRRSALASRPRRGGGIWGSSLR